MSAAHPVLAFVNSTFGWMVVLFLALLLFGSRLPKVARNLGKGINEFKKGLNDGDAGAAAEDDDEDDDQDDDRPAPRRPAKSSAKRGIDDTSV